MLIGLHGRKQSGKDTVYERVAKIMGDTVPVERTAFADLMYESAASSLGVTVDELRAWRIDPNVTVQVVGTVHGMAGPLPVTLACQTVRRFIQDYGQGHRALFGESFWVDRVELEHAHRILVVTDVRMENEALAVRRAGGAVVGIIGPPEVENAGDGHITEARLPDELVDAWVKNDVRDDGFRSLDRKVDTLLRLHLGGDLPR